MHTPAIRPPEIKTVYPHRQAVPRGTWLSLFGSAEHEIGILANSGLFLAQDPDALRLLTSRVRAGVRMRICLRDPDGPAVAEPGAPEDVTVTAARIHAALTLYGQLREAGDATIRLHRAVLYNSIYRADDQLLVSQHAHGIPDKRAPALHLRQTADGDMVTTYLDAFERIWATAIPVE